MNPRASNGRWSLLASLAWAAGGLALLGPAQPVQAGQKQAGQKAAVVAVFLMESRGSPLEADEVVGLTDYLAARLGEGGRLSIIPRDELRKRLAVTKTGSHKECFDSSCQIELGRELAAEYSIASAISKVGSFCLITASVWDLRRATQIKAASEKRPCDKRRTDVDQLIDAVESIAVTLDAAMSGKPIPRKPPAVDQQSVAELSGAAGPVRSKHLGLPNGVFGEADQIPIAWHGLPGSRGDWVSVASQDMPADTYLTYMYTGGLPAGTFPLGGLNPGNYEARIYLDWPKGGYRIIDKLAFAVQAAAPAPQPPPGPPPGKVPAGPATKRSKHLGLAKLSFSAGEPVEVFWHGTSGSRYDWVAVVPKDTPDTDAGSHYDYLKDKKDGSFVVDDLEPGDYEVRIYLDYNNLGYQVADRLSFAVR